MRQPKLTIQERFEQFDRENPEVFELIVGQVKKAIEAGKEKFSIKVVVEWIRWETFVQPIPGGPYKLNNDFSSRYSRKLITMFPHWEKHIEQRCLKTA